MYLIQLQVCKTEMKESTNFIPFKHILTLTKQCIFSASGTKKTCFGQYLKVLVRHLAQKISAQTLKFKKITVNEYSLLTEKQSYKSPIHSISIYYLVFILIVYDQQFCEIPHLDLLEPIRNVRPLCVSAVVYATLPSNGKLPSHDKA